jgi:hypothetical protein
LADLGEPLHDLHSGECRSIASQCAAKHGMCDVHIPREEKISGRPGSEWRINCQVIETERPALFAMALPTRCGIDDQRMKVIDVAYPIFAGHYGADDVLREKLCLNQASTRRNLFGSSAGFAFIGATRLSAQPVFLLHSDAELRVDLT